MRVASRVAERLRKLGNIKKTSKPIGGKTKSGHSLGIAAKNYRETDIKVL